MTNIKEIIKSTLASPSRLFLVLSTFFGLSMVVAMPVFMVPDEGAHFLRTYQVSRGGLIPSSAACCTGGLIPSKIPQHMGIKKPEIGVKQVFSEKIINTNLTLTDFRTSSIYTPLAYIPQSLGVGIAQIIYPSLGVMVLFGRILSLITYIVIVFIAIKKARVGSWVYVVVGLFPVSIQQAASLSPDAMVISLSLLSASIIQSSAFKQTALLAKDKISLIVSSILLTLIKPANIFLIIPSVFIKERGRKRVIFIILSILLPIILYLFWYLILKKHGFNENISQDATINQTDQIKYIFNKPIIFMKVVLRTLLVGDGGYYGPDYFYNSIYGSFSWNSYRLNQVGVFIGYISLIVAFLYSANVKYKKKLISKLAMINAVSILLYIISVTTLLYLSWTPVGGRMALGMHGRYFIPIIPMFIPIFIYFGKWLKLEISNRYVMGIILGTIATINLSTMVLLTVNWFYL